MLLIKPSQILIAPVLNGCLAISLLLTPCLTIAVSAQAELSITQLIEEGETAASKNDWPKAMDLFLQASKKDDKSFVAFYDLGVAYLHINEPQKAKAMEEKALALKPDFVSAYIQLGAINAKLGDVEEAEESLLKALTIDPKNPIAQESLNALRTFKQNGTPNNVPLPTPEIVPVQMSAAPAEKNSSSVDSNVNIDSLQRQAKAAYAVGNLHKAKELLSKVTEIDQQNSAAYSALGVVAGAEGNFAEEMRLEKKAISFDEKNAVAHLNLAWVLARLERTAEAISEYDQVLELVPESEEAETGKAILLAKSGNNDQALAILDDLLAKSPSSYTIYLAKGMVLAETNRNEAAELEIKKALELAPHQRETRLRLASFYLKSAQWSEAEKLYSQLAKEFPDNATVWLGLGLALSKNGAQPAEQGKTLSAERMQSLTEAVTAFQKACSLAPKDTDMHLALGMALAACGKAQGAKEELRAAWELKPKFEIAASGKGVI